MVPENTQFLSTYIHLLEKRFSLSYFQDYSCAEYFLDSRDTGRHVSENLILSRDDRSNGLYISKFYPRLVQEETSKYLSAACFYLMVQHAAHLFHLKDLCTVWLETDTLVYKDFYAKLREFEFDIARVRIGGKVCLKGVFHDLPIHCREIACLDDPYFE